MSQRLVLLHGWGANAADLRPLGGQLAAQHPNELDVMCLEAPQPHVQTGGRQWYGLFPPDWAAVPEAVHDLRVRLLKISSDSIPLERTVLFGFSQGGAMALSCGCSLPLAGVISCSGYPHPDWQPPHDHPPVLALHGLDDEVVPPAALEMITARLTPERCQNQLLKNGHTITTEMMQPLQNALQAMLTLS
ncbi:alpha/beta fold hydrolase [Synechococcus sp. M16CYN]|uniref:alpha/beta hydrolase n=1 Tax=Synechococcus sp. M16CYN TaxID=3103139 RepID=UPI0032499F6B